MLIAAKVLGATCLAGALATSGVLTTDHLTHHPAPATATLVSDPHASFEALAVGAEARIPAGDAGSLTVRRTASGLEVAAVAPAEGWTSLTKTIAPDWIIVTFANGDRKVDVSLDIVNDSLRVRRAAFTAGAPTTTTTEAPTTTTTAPTTTTTDAPPPPAPAPEPVTLPPPVQPTVIPVAGAGTVVIVVEGPVVVVRDVKALPGWIASVERRSGDVDVVFRQGDRSFRFFASLADHHLTSAVREVRADRDHPVRAGDFDRGDDSGGHRHRH